MMITTVKQLAEWCSGKIARQRQEEYVADIVTDSRVAHEGCAFVALIGERFDGHQFIPDAILKGAKTIIVQSMDFVPNDAKVNVILVEDTLKALGAIASSYLRHVEKLSHKKIVAVTGSSGKTTTKEMVSAILARSLNVLTSPESYNNEVGIPLTLLRLVPEHDVIVLEYAARHIGDIAYLCTIAKPNVGIITNVGKAHIGIFGSQEAIEQAKGELIEAIDEDGYAILNGDDPAFERMKGRTRAKVLSFSVCNEGCDAHAVDVRQGLFETVFRANVLGRIFDVRIPMLGTHNVSNALAALLAVHSIKGELDNGDVEALSTFEPPKMRMQIHPRSDEVTIINDAYNANPNSMRAALKTLQSCNFARRRIAVLGEMRELGEASYKEHFNLGWELVDYGVDVLVVVGSDAQPVAEGARQRLKDEPDRQMRIITAFSADEAVNVLRRIIKAGDAILIKASRAVELDRIAEQLLE